MTGYSVELDTLFHPNGDTLFSDLETYGVYRIYAEMTNSADYLSAISNIANEQVASWALTSEGTFFHDTLGSDYGNLINPAFFDFYPTLAYDSWWTIGLEPGESGVVNAAIDPNITPFDDWNAGNDFVVNTFFGGSIFVTSEVEYVVEVDPLTLDTLTYPVVVGPSSGLGGESLKVLVAQVTVNHSFVFEACAQVFPLGIQENQQQFCPEPILVEHPYADGVCVNDADSDGICDEFEVPGCTDEIACNYDPDATELDDSCEYADIYDCEGNCVNDDDEDGICNELEIPGCIDPDACNFNPDATDELNETCEYADIYDCEGNCVNDDDDDGVCNELEVPGCTDVEACNFDQEATDLDNSCVYPGAPCDDGNSLTYADELQGCECQGFSCHDEDACNFSLDGIEDNDFCDYVVSSTIQGNDTPFSQTLQEYTYPSTAAGSTFEWSVEGGDILGGNGTNELSVVWNEEGPGLVTVVETSASGCEGETVFLFVDVTLSSVAEMLNGSLAVFPVPAVDHLQLVWTGPALNNAYVSIRDAAGRVVKVQNVAARDVLQLGGLSAGTYMLEFTVPTLGSIQRRVMIQ